MAILAAGTCNADLNVVAGVGTTITAANKYTNVQEAMDFSDPSHIAWFDFATQNDVWVSFYVSHDHARRSPSCQLLRHHLLDDTTAFLVRDFHGGSAHANDQGLERHLANLRWRRLRALSPLVPSNASTSISSATTQPVPPKSTLPVRCNGVSLATPTCSQQRASTASSGRSFPRVPALRISRQSSSPMRTRGQW